MSEALKLADQLWTLQEFHVPGAVAPYIRSAAEMLRTQAAEIVSLSAERDAMKADSERYWWLLDYLVSDSTKHDDAMVEAKTSDELDTVISAAKEQGK